MTLAEQAKEALEGSTPGPWWPAQNTVGSWVVETIRDGEDKASAGRPYGANICMGLGDQTEARTRDSEADNAKLIALTPDLARAVLAAEELVKRMDWQSPYDPPPLLSSIATRVIVRVERYPNPPALNAPERIAFGHYLRPPKDGDLAPKDGWYFDNQNDYERVNAWRYIEFPHAALQAYRAATGGQP